MGRYFAFFLLHLYSIVDLCRQVEAASFNVAFAAGVEARVEALLNEPFTRALDPLAASFNSRWSYIYDGEHISTNRNYELMNYVHDNASIAVFWILTKDTDVTGITGFDFVYVGFENGKHWGYRIENDNNDVILYYMESGNSSCPEFGIDANCRYAYYNATDQITGHKYGPPTKATNYDPRYRPWYTAAQAGKLWSEPYVFAENLKLGITAVRQMLSSTSQFLGVFAVDYDLLTIDNALDELVTENTGTNVEDDTDDYSVFVVESNGYLIASSSIGASVSYNSETGLAQQVYALNSSVDIIAVVTAAIMKSKAQGGGGGWVSSNGTTLIVEVPGHGRYWAQSQEVQNGYDLNWFVVIAQPVYCDVGYYVPVSKQDVDCVICPEGAVCLGGAYMPYPERDYWVDRSNYVYGDKFYPCPFGTCRGYSLDQRTLSCWTESGFNQSKCLNDFNNLANDADDSLICAKGAAGPLCGYCIRGYHRNSGASLCVNCEDKQARLQLIVVWSVVGAILAIACFVVIIDHYSDNESVENNSEYVQCLQRFWSSALRHPPLSLLKHIDSGMAKVVWVTAQILSTVPWNLSVTYPDPFDSYLVSRLQYFQLDFVPWKCFITNDNFLLRVYILSFTPIALAFLDLLIYFIRVYYHGMNITDIRLSEYGTSTGSKLISQHAYFALLLSYLVLPVCSLVQFSALSCITLKDGQSYLKADTSVNCNSSSYKHFILIDSCFIVAYQSVPLIWLMLLWRVKDKINPSYLSKKNQAVESNIDLGEDESYSSVQDPHQVIFESTRNLRERLVSVNSLRKRSRDKDYSIQYLAFLWQDYKPSKWYFEVCEMYRRTVFVALIPLLGGDSELRSIFGTLLSIIMVAFLSEAAPYTSKITNTMLVVAQYQILFTFFVAVVISADALDSLHMSNFSLGVMLIGVNLLLLVIVFYCSFKRMLRERYEAKWKKTCNTEQLSIINTYMNNFDEISRSFKNGVDAPSSSNYVEMSSSSSVSDQGRNRQASTAPRIFTKRSVESVLQRYILKPDDVKLKKKIGAGAYGEVFQAKCLGQPVAIKTMLDVTEQNVKNFRSEILITALLRHPNIVNFVGACWGRELICLVLEWVPNGTLAEFLIVTSLTWSQPLLRMAVDISRGMVFLQDFIYFDEVDGFEYKGIIHRDLSTSNCMIGEHSMLKIGDFGGAHPNSPKKIRYSETAGTPFFAAPEVVLGTGYSDKADVYSFGMILASLAIKGDLIQNIKRKCHLGSQQVFEDFHQTKAKKVSTARLLKMIYEEGFVVFDAASKDKHEAINNEGDNGINHVENGVSLQKNDSHISNSGGNGNDDYPSCPPIAYELISKCCSRDPNNRPSFPYIMEQLLIECDKEINSFSTNLLLHERKDKLLENAGELAVNGQQSGDVPDNTFMNHSNEYRANPILRNSHHKVEVEVRARANSSVSFRLPGSDSRRSNEI